MLKPPKPDDPLPDREELPLRDHQLSPGGLDGPSPPRPMSVFDRSQFRDGRSNFGSVQLSPSEALSMKSASEVESPVSRARLSQKLFPSASLRSSVPATRSKIARLTAGVSSSGPTF